MEPFVVTQTFHVDTSDGDRRKADADRTTAKGVDHRRLHVHHPRSEIEEQLGAHRTDVGWFRRRDEWAEPTGLHDRVVVDQRDEVRAVEVGHPDVAATGEPLVAVVGDDAHRRSVATQGRDHVVGGGVVDDHHLQLVPVATCAEQGIHTPKGDRAAVVVEHHHADGRHRLLSP